MNDQTWNMHVRNRMTNNNNGNAFDPCQLVNSFAVTVT